MSLPDSILRSGLAEMAAGLIDAELGAHLSKKRIPMLGRGKRSGARTILGSNLGHRWFPLFGFEKNERATIDKRELAALQKIATALLSLDATRRFWIGRLLGGELLLNACLLPNQCVV